MISFASFPRLSYSWVNRTDSHALSYLQKIRNRLQPVEATRKKSLLIILPLPSNLLVCFQDSGRRRSERLVYLDSDSSPSPDSSDMSLSDHESDTGVIKPFIEPAPVQDAAQVST